MLLGKEKGYWQSCTLCKIWRNILQSWVVGRPRIYRWSL